MFTEFVDQTGGGNASNPLDAEKEIIEKLLIYKGDDTNKEEIKNLLTKLESKISRIILRKKKIKFSNSRDRMEFLVEVLINMNNTTSETISSGDNTQEISDGPINNTLLELIQKVKAELNKKDLHPEQVTKSLEELFPQTSSV
jgi:hypothetical protein